MNKEKRVEKQTRQEIGRKLKINSERKRKEKKEGTENRG